MYSFNHIRYRTRFTGAVLETGATLVGEEASGVRFMVESLIRRDDAVAGLGIPFKANPQRRYPPHTNFKVHRLDADLGHFLGALRGP